MSKKQVTEATNRLQERGLIKKYFQNEMVESIGNTIPVLYIDLIPDKVIEISTTIPDSYIQQENNLPSTSREGGVYFQGGGAIPPGIYYNNTSINNGLLETNKNDSKESLTHPSGVGRKIPKDPVIEENNNSIIEKQDTPLTQEEAAPVKKKKKKKKTTDPPPVIIPTGKYGEPMGIINLSDECRSVLDTWNNSRFLRKHEMKYGYYCNAVKKANSFIKELINGTAFLNISQFKKENRAYTVEEIQQAITKFSVVASSPEYPPTNKKILKTLSLDQFFYNPIISGTKSWFLKCLNGNLKTYQDITIPKGVVHFYNGIIKAWKKHYDEDPDFSYNEKQKLIQAAIKLDKKWDEISDKVDYFGDRTFDEDLWAEWLILGVLDKFENISPGSLASNFAFDVAMPDYLIKKGRLNSREEPDE